MLPLASLLRQASKRNPPYKGGAVRLGTSSGFSTNVRAQRQLLHTFTRRKRWCTSFSGPCPASERAIYATDLQSGCGFWLAHGPIRRHQRRVSFTTPGFIQHTNVAFPTRSYPRAHRWQFHSMERPPLEWPFRNGTIAEHPRPSTQTNLYSFPGRF